MSQITLPISRLPHGADIPLPSYGTPDSAGMDLCAAIDEDVIMEAGERFLVPTGLSMELPSGYEAQLRPRSGLALKHGITVLNAPATIDADYRGEVKVILINLGDVPFVVTRGMRVAQMVVAPVTRVELNESGEALSQTQRAAGGFGSTGM